MSYVNTGIMKKLYVFGDSYGVHFNRDYTNPTIAWSWINLLKERLGVDQVVNRSDLGVSNEYIQYQIMCEERNIKKQDVVLIISTSIMRKWFWKEFPYANIYANNLSSIVGKDRAEAGKAYLKNMFNIEFHSMTFYQFLGWVHHLTDTNGWNTIIIPGFEERGYPVSHRYQVRGSLIDICEKEFESKNTLDWYWLNFKGLDQRAGHLCKDNHQILADKIYSTLATGVELDLTVGFREKMISKNNFDSIKDQLMDFKDFNLENFHIRERHE